ncbi:MAG: glucosyl-3-phosphoglycerate synthase [Actinomycetota bacterium]
MEWKGRVRAMSEPHRRDLTVAGWMERRTFRAEDFDLDSLLVAKGDLSISALLPAREVAATIAEVVGPLVRLRRAGLIDEVVVIDAGSTDGTATIAADAGATVHQRADLLGRFGPPLGKGDGIWRGLSVTSGDIVMMFDTDTQNFGEHFALGLVGPLLTDPGVSFVKGAFDRPLHLGDVVIEGEGGRVTELVARPLLNMFVPQLAGFLQPLAGEVAGRRELFEDLSVPVGYGVEVAMLIDALASVGLEGMAQVDLGTRVDCGQPLKELSLMAYTVTATILRRTFGSDLSQVPNGVLLPSSDGVDLRAVFLDERPPLRMTLEEEAAEG